MKNKLFLTAGMAVLMAACNQQQTMTEVPVSTLNVESLKDNLDLDMDINTLQLGDLHVLGNAPAARQGYPFKDAYLRGVYGSTTWYDSLTWVFDESLNFDSIPQKDGESWRDYYYRATQALGAVKFTTEEQAFMKRVQEREEELRQENFDTPKGLRVRMDNLTNPTQMTEWDSTLCQQLAEDGFAIVPANHNQLFHVYEQNDYQQFPSFVTTDLYLQLYHLYFDCMLRDIEQNALYKQMTDLTLTMYTQMHERATSDANGELRQLARHDAIYFAVAYELLTGTPIATGDEQATTREEVAKVMKSVDDTSTFMEDYRDVMFTYSLFRPRGHYTRNETLQRYFRGMMWLQSVPFGLDHDNEVKEAVLLAAALDDNKKAQRCYYTVNHLMNNLMGQPDNLSIPQLEKAMQQTETNAQDVLSSEQELQTLKERLNEMGDRQTRIRPKFERTSHNKICLMPQRYQPDAEVLQEMVDYDSKPTKRATPQGLDFMAAMGVSAAEQVLMEQQQSWKGFDTQLKAMKRRMGEINWYETIANKWLLALKSVNNKPEDMPYFMDTPAWERKTLNTALASWAELKHDAILYAKQPFGAECGGGGLPDPVVKGYVEPNTCFWHKACDLLDDTSTLLTESNMMTEKVKEATQRLREEARFLERISEKELRGETPTDEEFDQLKCIGATFENISLGLISEPDQCLMGWNDVQGTDRQVALVADVYTANADNNPEKSILYEAVGNADEIYVVVEFDGYLYLTRGAVLSYREFTQPMSQQRLTDEEWQQQLRKNPRKGVPAWMKPITVPMKKAPAVNEEFFYSSGC